MVVLLLLLIRTPQHLTTMGMELIQKCAKAGAVLSLVSHVLKPLFDFGVFATEENPWSAETNRTKSFETFKDLTSPANAAQARATLKFRSSQFFMYILTTATIVGAFSCLLITIYAIHDLLPRGDKRNFMLASFMLACGMPAFELSLMAGPYSMTSWFAKEFTMSDMHAQMININFMLIESSTIWVTCIDNWCFALGWYGSWCCCSWCCCFARGAAARVLLLVVLLLVRVLTTSDARRFLLAKLLHESKGIASTARMYKCCTLLGVLALFMFFCDILKV